MFYKGLTISWKLVLKQNKLYYSVLKKKSFKRSNGSNIHVVISLREKNTPDFEYMAHARSRTCKTCSNG